MKIIPLSEGAFTIDQTKVFVPFDLSKDNLQERPLGSLLVEIQPFLVVTEQDVLLLDTGLGYSSNGVLQLYENLASHGFSSHDVTKVLMSHLHRDHAGGLTLQDSFHGTWHLAFPNALHYIHHQELDFALHGKNASYDPERLEILSNNDKLVLIHDEGLIDGYIQHQFSGGHSPFHQVFWIRENGKTVFFGGDEAPQLQQMKTKFVAKYDYNGKRAMELRQAWWEQAKHEEWEILFYHDIAIPSSIPTYF
jgi:glyoxylase-like metal-dependent hydrolase (beta-lactamase superfamily II)